MHTHTHILPVHVPGDGANQPPPQQQPQQHMAGPTHQPGPPTIQHQVNGGYYHPGNVNGAPPPGPPMGGGGGIPPPGGHPGGGYGMPQYAPPSHRPGSVDTPSTQMTELLTSPAAAGNHAPQLNYTGMVSPAAVNSHNTGYIADAVGAMNIGRPHDLPIQGYQGYHHGNPTGEVSHMYNNSDAPVGEQVDIRQPPFPTVGGEDLICGQGELWDTLCSGSDQWITIGQYDRTEN